MRGPERLLLGVGIVVGLAFALLYPPWAAGADEATHFARALEVSRGRLVPDEIDGRPASPIPASYRRDEDQMIGVLFSAGPFNANALDTLRQSRPDWSVTEVFETQPTMAAPPLAYAPSAIAMIIPDRLGWAGVWVLWAGRLGNLILYLGLAWLAVRVATAFRWTLAIAALFPMNIGIAASVTPDALTIGALLVAIAVWTRVWRPRPVADGADDVAGADIADEEAARGRELALAALGSSSPVGASSGSADTGRVTTGATDADGPVDESAAEPAPTGRTSPGRVARLGEWTRTPIGTGAMVLAAGLLLVAAKPPYFFALVAFPLLLATGWRDRRLRAAAAGGVLALLVGGVVTAITSSTGYKAVSAFGAGINGSPTYQPDVQQQHILSDPFGFIGRVIADWFGNLDTSVQRWVRHVGYVEVGLPSWVSWVFVVVVVVAAVLLDRRDLLGLRRIPRAIWVLIAPALAFALYASAYLYSDDTVEGVYMGLQAHRYLAPLFAMTLMGWAPRFPLQLPRRVPWAGRIPTWVPVVGVVTVELVMIVAAARTWNVVGWSLGT
jgi:uncharacterized membrane protein